MTAKTYLPALILSASIFGGATVIAFSHPLAPPPPPQAGGLPSEASASAKTYEELATAIIGIEKAEDELVRTILIGYHTAAQELLKNAKGANAVRMLEGAATQVSNIANEGDGAIRAVRQRLAQAGHTHNTDVETKEDYMFVTNKEKKELLALAQKISKLGAGVTDEQLKQTSDELRALVTKALADE